MNRSLSLTDLPSALRIEDAVEAACAADIAFIEERIRRGTSVLVVCDKELTLYLYLAIRQRLRRVREAPRLTLVDGRPRADDPPASTLTRMIQQLTDAVRGSVERTIIVLPHLDILTASGAGGLSMEAREVIPVLYENPEATLLAFCDPSFPIPKMIQDVFAARREITGIPREALPKLITQREAAAVSTTEFDPFGLYKYLSGLNPVRVRRLLGELGHRHEAPPGRSNAQEVYTELRKQTVTDGIELPNVSLDKDIGGYDEVKARLKEELIELVLRKDTLKTEGDIKALEDLLPRGVIFHGPPGTGKTFFAKAIATALNATVFIVAGSEMKSKWHGESEENIRRVFRQARQSAPSVIVFDELDAFAHQRGHYGGGSGVEHSMVNQLLTEMDGFRKNEMVFVIGTTNFLESLDGALMRPGRFEFLIEIPAPNAEDRAEIVKIYDKKLSLGLTDALVAHLVRRTEGMADREKGIPFSGDHLYAVCRALKRQQIREGTKDFGTDDLDKALQRKTRRPIVLSAVEEKVIAVHEAGHALLAMLVPRATPPEKISIQSDMEGALGYVLRAARARPYAMTEVEMRADICVGLGGQTAEKIVFGEVSVGASSDLQQASTIARSMVEYYGMSNLGPRVRLPDEEDGRALSAERLTKVEQAVEAILVDEASRARTTLEAHRTLLDALTKLLLEKKILDAASLQNLVQSH